MDCGKVFEFLRQVPFLQRLPGSSLRKLAEVVQVKQYELSEYVVREGEIGDGIYFILEGQVEISGSASTEEGNHSDLLLKQYDYFGYESGGSIHQANVVALSKLTCLVLPNSYRSLLQPKSIWYADESPGGLSLMEHILCLEPLEVDIFRGFTLPDAPSFRQVFGGQLIGQALAAASKTVDCLKLVHNLHAMFILAGENNSGGPRTNMLVGRYISPVLLSGGECHERSSHSRSNFAQRTVRRLCMLVRILGSLFCHSFSVFSLEKCKKWQLVALQNVRSLHWAKLSQNGSIFMCRGLFSAACGRPQNVSHLSTLEPPGWHRAKSPIVYQVHRVRDGNSFATRRVDAKQNGYVIFTLFASFQKVEEGFEHQEAFLPHVPAPEMLLNIEELRERRLADLHLSMEYRNKIAKKKFIPWPIEIRFCEDYHFSEQSPPRLRYWLKVKGKLTDDPALHRCVLAYASDLIFGGISLNPHRRRGLKIASLSLDHSIWFHRSVRADDWLLFVIESPSACGGRGLSFGRMFNRRGELIMSLTQEGLIRKAKQQNEDLNSKL
ncbi:unnamed protein product [Musa textilis]